MSKKKNRVKLPKRFLGVKIPKPVRKDVNALLKHVPASTLKPLIGAAVAALAAALAARLEEPLREFAEAEGEGGGKKKTRKRDMATPTAH